MFITYLFTVILITCLLFNKQKKIQRMVMMELVYLSVVATRYTSSYLLAYFQIHTYKRGCKSLIYSQTYIRKNIQRMVMMEMVYLSVVAFKDHRANQGDQEIVELFTNLIQKQTVGRKLQS